MTIVHFHKSIRLEHGGVVRAVLDLCPALAAAGHDVVLATPDPHDVPESWDGTGGRPRVHPVPGGFRPGGLLTRAGLRSMRELLSSARVLHLHGMWSTHNVQLASLAQKLGVPYVYSVHGMLDDWSMAQRGPKKRLYLALAGRRTLERAARVHCTATAELDQAKRWFPRGQGVVAPLVMDLSDYLDLPGPELAHARLPSLTEGEPTLLFLSRLHYKKGVEHLIDAVQRLREGGRAVRAIIAGTGDEAYTAALRARVRELDLEAAIEFPGFVSGLEKVSLYQAADAFVLPTSQENFGFVLFEALAAATPVVTTKGTDTWPEMLESGGGVVTEQSAESIAAAIADLLDDPDRARTMGAAGRQWVMDHLGPEAVVGAYERLYHDAAPAD